MGVIDFGDLVYSWQVNEIAICAAYVLICLMYEKRAVAAPSGPAAAPIEAAAVAEGPDAAAMTPLLALRSVCRAYHVERALSDVGSPPLQDTHRTPGGRL